MRWCDEGFGPLLPPKNDNGRDEWVHSYACRKPVDHEGGHECPKSIEDGYALPDLTDIAEVEAWLAS